MSFERPPEPLQPEKDADIERWLRTDEAKLSLEKFDSQEKPEVLSVLHRVGLVGTGVLENRDVALGLVENRWMIDHIAQDHPLTTPSLISLGELERGEKVRELVERGDDSLEKAEAKVASLRLGLDKQDPRVVPMLQKLQEELGVYEPQFKGRAVAGVLWGSLYFGDPTDDPDIDFEFVAADAAAIHRDLWSVGRELPRYVGVDMHVNINNLAELEVMLQQFEQGNYQAAVGYDMADFTTLLTSEVIELPGADTPALRAALTHTAGEVRRVAEKEKLFRFHLLSQFIQMIEARQTSNRPARKQQ